MTRLSRIKVVLQLDTRACDRQLRKAERVVKCHQFTWPRWVGACSVVVVMTMVILLLSA